jgi:hypothetical protein
MFLELLVLSPVSKIPVGNAFVLESFMTESLMQHATLHTATPLTNQQSNPWRLVLQLLWNCNGALFVGGNGCERILCNRKLFENA